MNATQRPKRRHHHVWQNYLRPWTTGGALFCLQDGRIFPSGTRALAVRKDFYRLQRLTQQDVELLKLLFGNGHPSAARTHRSLIGLLTAPFEFAERFRGGPDWPQIEAQLDEMSFSVLEDCHASIESSFVPLLDRALRGDLGFYTDDTDCITFLNFLCMQYMRTSGIKERAMAAAPFLERIWNVMIHMSSTNIGASIYRERRQRKLVIVENFSDVAFITGDQPAINLKGTRPAPADNISFFYPISPTNALLLADVGEEPPYPASEITSDQARTFNRMIARASHKQVFARSKSCLSSLYDGA